MNLESRQNGLEIRSCTAPPTTVIMALLDPACLKRYSNAMGRGAGAELLF